MSLPTSRPPEAIRPDASRLEPAPTLLSRLRAEASASFIPGKPIRISRAPGRLDVMGGIAEYTGALVCQTTLECGVAVTTQPRDDRVVQILSFNLLDEHLPFTLMVPLDTLANCSLEQLKKEFAQLGRGWAASVAGCLAVLQEQSLVDWRDPSHLGLNIAIYSTIPSRVGAASTAAAEVATMMNLVHHLGLGENSHAITPMKIAELCQHVQNQIVGVPSGLVDALVCCTGQSGAMLRFSVQSEGEQNPLNFPDGIRCVGIHSGMKHSVGLGQYRRTRCAAFMAHKIILEKMKQMGLAAGKVLTGDPLNGYLANLMPPDYKKLFRQFLPEQLKGGAFLLASGGTFDKGSTVEPDVLYAVQNAADHHVLEANRVRNFVSFLEEAQTHTDPAKRQLLLNKAGHLMYASHMSYTNDAKLGTDDADLLVDLVRQRESQGLYGARITAGGGGGIVAVLCDNTDRATSAIQEILSVYQTQTGKNASAFVQSSPNAWQVGTTLA